PGRPRFRLAPRVGRPTGACPRAVPRHHVLKCRAALRASPHDNVTEEPSAATEDQVLSCSTLDRPELGPRLFGRNLPLVDLAAVLLGELDELVLGSLRGPAALTLHGVLHASTSSRAGY